MKIPFKTDKIEAHQHLLFPSNLFDLLPLGHDCFLYASLFDQLDTSEVEALYSHKGQHGYSPRKLIGILTSIDPYFSPITHVKQRGASLCLRPRRWSKDRRQIL